MNKREQGLNICCEFTVSSRNEEEGVNPCYFFDCVR